ncbi:TOX high mobility group box family member 3-like isoform X2 [Anopheles cruzii]|uniref:TOX high mobility group box family member 3-like isoform X2 n=1 Tax=Anopheles cruzii TaxID=68878 RepID=UPI0022EC2E30|nr:TOX high mobility group box family member 3-like isoform X2 [Anopheles cruzii]
MENGYKTFHTPSFGDEEFDIQAMGSNHLQQQHQQHNHHHQQQQQPSQQQQQQQYQMHSGTHQPSDHMGLLQDQQQQQQPLPTPAQQQQQNVPNYGQWHQEMAAHHSSYTLQSPTQPTYHQLNTSPNNNPTLHVMQPPQQSPSMVPPQQQQQQQQQQLSPQQLIPGNPLNFIGRSPPQNGVAQGNENGTTSDDSDDTIATNSLKRPSSEPSYGDDSSIACGMKASTAAAAAAAAAAAKKPKVTKKKKKRDPNEPQKPVSAYALFFRDTQAAIKGQTPNASFGEVSKIVASMWDVLALEHKNVYKKKTEAAKKDYLKALAAYRASLVSKGTEVEQQPSPQQSIYSTTPQPASQQQQTPQHQQQLQQQTSQHQLQQQPQHQHQQHQQQAQQHHQHQQSHHQQHQNNLLVNHAKHSPQHGASVAQSGGSHHSMQGQLQQTHTTYGPSYGASFKPSPQNMIQMAHQHSHLHPGQISAASQTHQPAPHLHGQMVSMNTQQQMMAHQQSSAHMNIGQQHTLSSSQNTSNAAHNAMMNLSMTPQSHYMNQQASNQLQEQHQQLQQQQLQIHQPQQNEQGQVQATGGMHIANGAATSEQMNQHNAASPITEENSLEQTIQPQQCIRQGCTNLAIINSDWEDEYCSNECVITHCRDVFGHWLQNNNTQQQTFSTVK